jgi:hypothetical protein
MEEKPIRTRKNRSMSKDAPLGEVFTNRIKALDSVFDDGYDLTQNNSDSKSGASSPAAKPSHKKSLSQKK